MNDRKIVPSGDGLQSALFTASAMTEPWVGNCLGGKLCIFSTPSPERTDANEDSAAFIPYDEKSGVLVVADGMGGHASGKEASRYAVEALDSCMKEGVATGIPIRAAILNGIEAANTAVQAIGNGAGTTLAVCEISDGCVRSYHVGDSIVLVAGQRGKLKLYTTSHSPIGYAEAAGLIDENAAMHHPERHLVLNALGTDDMRVEIGSPLQLAQNDTVLLGSDGLTDNISLQEILAILQAERADDILNALVSKSRARMMGSEEGPSKADDLTVMIYHQRS